MADDSNATSARDKFVEYYEAESLSPETYDRFQAIYDLLFRVRTRNGDATTSLSVLDVGCGAGTQCLLWARNGHAVSGVDINRDLIDVARERISNAGFDIDMRVGSATELPFESESFDVCLVPELLEHVQDWTACLDECVRVLKPRGLIYISTTNALCPKQQEYDLPFYSWYPGFLKRRYERLAITTRPELANFAAFPAVHWFTYRQLESRLEAMGFRCMDRFDVIDAESKGPLAKALLVLIRGVAPVRWLAHVATPYTLLVGIRD